MTQMTPRDSSPVHPLTASQPQPPSSNEKSTPKHVDILILGAGWLSQILLPLLVDKKISHAATTTTGRDDTIPFKFDPRATSLEPYRSLPSATTVLVTFPLPSTSTPPSSTTATTIDNSSGDPTTTAATAAATSAAKILLDSYRNTHSEAPTPHWILLGSTGEWKGPGWHDRHSPPPKDTPPSTRWRSESDFLQLGGCVLHLAGLYGANPRDSRIWELAVPKTKEGVKGKTGVHFIHGRDVSRGVVAVHLLASSASSAAGDGKWEQHGKGQRWILTDGRTYDWWTLIWENARHLDQQRFGDEGTGTYRRWVLECMREDNVRGLPRDGDGLGRRMDSREFWETWEVTPGEKGFGWPE